MTASRPGLPLVPVLVLVAACSMVPAPLASQRPGGAMAQELAARLEHWRAQGVADYSWQVAFGCECLLNGPTTITVADGAPTAVRNESIDVGLEDLEGFPLTVDALLEEGLRTLAGGGSVEATWDAATGLPRRLLLDRVPNAMDDELSVEVLSFRASG